MWTQANCRISLYLSALAFIAAYTVYLASFPVRLETYCTAASEDEPDQTSSLRIMDCLTCHNFQSDSVLVKGKVQIQVQLKANSDPQQTQSTLKVNSAVAMYDQSECYDYQCKSLHQNSLEDFGFENSAETLNELTFKNKGIVSTKKKLCQNAEDLCIELEGINSEDTKGFMLRYRYDISQLTETEPGVWLYQLQQGLYHRLALILVTLISLDLLRKQVLIHFSTEAVAYLLLLGFINEYFQASTSCLSVLTILKMGNLSWVHSGILSCIWLISAFMQLQQALIVNFLLLLVFTFCQLDQNTDCFFIVSLCLKLVLVFGAFMYGLRFYLNAAPQLLLCLMVLFEHSEKDVMRASYRSISKLEEEDAEIQMKPESLGGMMEV